MTFPTTNSFIRELIKKQFMDSVRELSTDNSLPVIKNSNVHSSEDNDRISCDKPFVIWIYICNLYVISYNSFIYIYKALITIDGKAI